MDILPEVRTSSEIYGNIVDGILNGVPISGVRHVSHNILLLFLNSIHPLFYAMHYHNSRVILAAADHTCKY